MIHTPTTKLFISHLKDWPVSLDPNRRNTALKCASYALSEHHRNSPVSCDNEFELHWEKEFEEDLTQSYEVEEIIEYGAEGIAWLVCISRHDNAIRITRSSRGTGIDYWAQPAGLKEQAFRLEVSGIRKGSKVDVQKRLAKKENQTHKSDGLGPCLIVIAEFSQPIIRAELR